MKLTKIRVNGEMPENMDLQLIQAKVQKAIFDAGYLTDVELVNSTCIKVGQRMRSFSVCLQKHGYNTQHSMGAKRLTNLPTWAQRVEFNDILNKVLNHLNVSCNIKSGPFQIRKGSETLNESDWYDQKPEWLYHNESRGFFIEAGNYKLMKMGV